jgi:hypothetical protein
MLSEYPNNMFHYQHWEWFFLFSCAHVIWFIFWGNSTYSIKICKLQEKFIRIMTNIRNRDSCRVVFKDWRILPFYSWCMYSLLTFVLNNSKLFITNCMVCNVNTRQGSSFHLPLPRLTVYQKGIYYFGPKLFNLLKPSGNFTHHQV